MVAAARRARWLPRPVLVVCACALLSADLVAEAKKKKKKKAAPMGVCEACETMVVDIQKAVKQQIRLKFMGKEDEDPAWEARLNHTCATAPKLAPHCEDLVASRKDDVVAALDALVKRSQDANERFMDLPQLRMALCGHASGFRACHANHHFTTRGDKEAVDAWFKNNAAVAATAYFLRHGKDRDDAALFVDDVKAVLEPGGWWKEAAFQHYTYRFLVEGQPWHKGVDVTLGPAGQQKFEAWSFEPRPNYVELDKPKMIPKPGVDRPEGWDDEEDGPWEPPMVKNPDLKKTDTPFYLRPLGEEEF